MATPPAREEAVVVRRHARSNSATASSPGGMPASSGQGEADGKGSGTPPSRIRRLSGAGGEQVAGVVGGATSPAAAGGGAAPPAVGHERRASWSSQVHACGNPAYPSAWTVTQVGKFLDWLGLAQYRESFAKNEISGRLFLELDRTDLQELGVEVLAHRKALLKAVQGLADDPHWVPSA